METEGKQFTMISHA